METKHGDTWGDYGLWIEKLRAERLRIAEEADREASTLLFRGQADAAWGLETSLERHRSAPISVAEYYDLALAAKPQLEAHLDKRWRLQSPQKYRQTLTSVFKHAPSGKVYEYYSYLRHHGFPSPLLDWSRSPYVAAFFAFQPYNKPIRAQSPSTPSRVAIFAYLEHTGFKSAQQDLSGGYPYIQGQGPHVRTHKRHFLQQSEYTICTDTVNRVPHYAAHPTDDRIGDQNWFWKFTLPIKEALIGLKRLDEYNINAHSLLGSTESLMEAVALRIFNQII